MKRFSLAALAAFTLLIPTVAGAQGATRLVYRPELRAYLPTPQQAPATAPPSTLTPGEAVARHEAMARGHRVTANDRGHAMAADHCDRMVKQAIAAAHHAN